MAWPSKLNTVPFLELKLLEPTAEEVELGVKNKPGQVNRVQMQQVERSNTCYFETLLLSVCYFPYRDQYLAHIVFRSRFFYHGDSRMTRAVISLEFSTPDGNISRFPQVKTVSPRENIGAPVLLVNDTDVVRLTFGDRTISFNPTARRHMSEDLVHNVTIQGGSRPHRNDPQIKNRAVWIIEEDRDLKAGIPPLFHGSLVVSCNSPFQMHFEVAVTQGISEAIGDFIRKAIQEADDPVVFDPSTPLDPLGLASEDMGQNLDNLARIPLRRFVNLSDPGATEL
jgi:hypothetical protein